MLDKPTNTPFRAVVCVYMPFGMDTNDFLIPKGGDDLDNYKNGRGTLALTASETSIAGDYAMPKVFEQYNMGSKPSGYSIIDMVNSDRCKVVANIGNILAQPTNTDPNSPGQVQYLPPPGLYNHAVQTEQWMSGRYDLPTFDKGWGGSALSQLGGSPSVVPRGFAFGGQSALLVGDEQIEMSWTKAIEPIGFTDANSGATTDFGKLMLSLLDTNPPTHSNVLVRTYAEQFLAMREKSEELNVHSPALSFDEFGDEDVYPYLGRQFRAVIQSMKAGRDSLGHTTQIFYVPFTESWDMHSNQSRLAGLLEHLSRALGYFQKQLENHGLADHVVTFTATDFSRSLRRGSASDPNSIGGTDHGWGGHSLVMSSENVLDTTAATSIVGTMHDFVCGGKYDADTGPAHERRGLWIPTTGVVQLAASLAQWLGVSEPDLFKIFPSLVDFPGPLSLFQ